MTYSEMQKAEAELNAAINPSKARKQRGATAEQLLARAKMLAEAKHARALCVNCGEPFGSHTSRMTYDCAMARS